MSDLLLDLEAVREELRRGQLDGWLVYDFKGGNPVLGDLLGAAPKTTRRVFLWIPAQGEPRLLAHSIDRSHLPSGLPATIYRDRHELQTKLGELLGKAKTVAMEYSPRCALPTSSFTDAGTVELVRSFGVAVAPSADLYSIGRCRLTPSQLDGHVWASERLVATVKRAFEYAAERAPSGLNEFQLAQWIRTELESQGLVVEEGPIVAVNGHSGDPHYEPTESASAPVRPGDWLLLDVWTRRSEPDAVYADVTWVGYLGEQAPAEHQQVFEAVVAARDAAVDYLRNAASRGEIPMGWQVDRVARDLLAARGYGDQFTHRLGHSLGHDVHGRGANLDDFETHDTRRLLPGTAFTVEPGVYRDDFGVRCEIDVVMSAEGPRVTTESQREIVIIAPR